MNVPSSALAGGPELGGGMIALIALAVIGGLIACGVGTRYAKLAAPGATTVMMLHEGQDVQGHVKRPGAGREMVQMQSPDAWAKA